MTEGEVLVEQAVEALSEYDMFQSLEARLEEILAIGHEILVVFGNIYGLLVFFVVVLLCWLVYRFFSMFFWSR